MPERFRSPEELKEIEIESKIKEKGPEGELRGGIVYEEEDNAETGEKKRFVYIGNPYAEQPTVVKLETDATREDIEAIKREIIPMPETFEMMEAMATTYKLKQPLLIEGPTAVGKTYTTEKFTELLYGRGTKPLDFYCSGQTDVSELMAKWVPRVESEEDQKRWNDFLQSLEAHSRLAQIAQEVEGKQTMSSEQRLALVHTKLQELAKSAGLSEKTQWRFQYGAVPKAMSMVRKPDGSIGFDDSKGTGYIIHIEEVGLAEPQVINALLKVRGKRGQLADEIQLWENGGKKIKSGPKFWAVFSTNPPEEYLARNEVDPALARGVVFKRVGELSRQSLNLAAEYLFTYKVGQKPDQKPEGAVLDIYNHPEIGKRLADTVATFHNDFATALKSGEKGRQQRIPLTLDDMARVSDYVVNAQLRSRETGQLDLTETLKRAINFYYLNRLADQELKATMTRNLDEILTGATGQVRYKDRTITRKELFDQLVSDVSTTAADKEKQAAQELERKQRELDQAKFSAEDQLENLLRNANIPDSIKDLLK